MDFSTTALNVLLLVAMAIPGFILVKAKLIKPSAIQYFAAVLLYVSQPFLSLRSFLSVEYSVDLVKNLGIVFGVSFAVQGVVFLLLCLVLRKWFDKPAVTAQLVADGYIDAPSPKRADTFELRCNIDFTNRGRALRVMAMASVFGNVGFFGVPLLQILFPSYPQAIAYSAVYIVSMNLMCWTFGAYVLTGDRRYISLKKALLNPQMIVLVVALPMFFCGVSMGSLPSTVTKIIDFLADMTAPLCMLILGMRFAVAPIRDLFTDWKVYFASVFKNLVFPLIVYLVLLPFKMDAVLRISLVLLSAMPVASITLNLAELFHSDRKTAANTILLSTLLCILTIPLILMLL